MTKPMTEARLLDINDRYDTWLREGGNEEVADVLMALSDALRQAWAQEIKELAQRIASHAEIGRINDALATAQAERDAALQRAEQAEAALAQAQAERDSLIKRLDFWIECNNSERANGRMPTFLNPYTILLWIGDKRAAAEADAAQPPALPPLPEGWVREGVRDIILYRSHDRYTGVDGHVPPGGQVSVHAEGLRVSTTHVPVADLLIVLRHAEAAHLTLQEGK